MEHLRARILALHQVLKLLLAKCRVAVVKRRLGLGEPKNLAQDLVVVVEEEEEEVVVVVVVVVVENFG
jgi:hypothetical protein